MTFTISSMNSSKIWFVVAECFIMPTENSLEDIIRDVHAAIDHKGQKKNLETNLNIIMLHVRAFISNCKRCTEKAKKNSISNY
jgi:Zn-finger protein